MYVDETAHGIGRLQYSRIWMLFPFEVGFIKVSTPGQLLPTLLPNTTKTNHGNSHTLPGRHLPSNHSQGSGSFEGKDTCGG